MHEALKTSFKKSRIQSVSIGSNQRSRKILYKSNKNKPNWTAVSVVTSLSGLKSWPENQGSQNEAGPSWLWSKSPEQKRNFNKTYQNFSKEVATFVMIDHYNEEEKGKHSYIFCKKKRGKQWWLQLLQYYRKMHLILLLLHQDTQLFHLMWHGDCSAESSICFFELLIAIDWYWWFSLLL